MNPETSLLAMNGYNIHYLHVPGSNAEKDYPPMVFLHEGLGSLELWRDFPFELKAELGHPEILVYSRPGYGRSTPVSTPRPIHYMHEEARTVLPHLLDALGIDNPILLGHSDGASIALIYAGLGHPVRGLVLIAPHVMVEKESIDGIIAAKEVFMSTDLRSRLGKYHRDPESTFWSWNNVWLSPGFEQWNIEEYLPKISVPTLCVQGDQDEYGTLAQLKAIADGVSGEVEIEIIAGAHHSPHLEKSAQTLEYIRSFLQRHMRESSVG